MKIKKLGKVDFLGKKCFLGLNRFLSFKLKIVFLSTAEKIHQIFEDIRAEMTNIEAIYGHVPDAVQNYVVGLDEENRATVENAKVRKIFYAFLYNFSGYECSRAPAAALFGNRKKSSQGSRNWSITKC